MFGRPASSSLFEAFFRDPFTSDAFFSGEFNVLHHGFDSPYSPHSPFHGNQHLRVSPHHRNTGVTITEMDEDEWLSDDEDEEETHRPLVEEPDHNHGESGEGRAKAAECRGSSIPVQHTKLAQQSYMFSSRSSYVRHGASPGRLQQQVHVGTRDVPGGQASAFDIMHELMESELGMFERNWVHRAGNSFLHPQSLFDSPFYRGTAHPRRSGAVHGVQERGRRINIQ